MNRQLSAMGAIALGLGLVAACSSSNIPAGQDQANVTGQFTTGWACACPNGETSCKLTCPDNTIGTCENGQPFCDISVGEAGWGCACPNGETTCSITCPDGSAGQCTNGQPVCGVQTDAGSDCCPANYLMYSCTYPDGGAGLACHNPQLGCAGSTTCGQGCDPVVTGKCGGGNLQWYTTCGYPVCPADAGAVTDAGGPACPPVGSACTSAGQTCGTPSNANCGSILVCATSDPKGGPGGCPISTKKYKDGITYVDDAHLQALHDETLGIKLATYTYKMEVADPGPTHLGFIIEDQPQSQSVDSMHNRVDMYGYLSMVVASMQVQEKEIAQLRKDLEAARHEAAACK